MLPLMTGNFWQFIVHSKRNPDLRTVQRHELITSENSRIFLPRTFWSSSHWWANIFDGDLLTCSDRSWARRWSGPATDWSRWSQTHRAPPGSQPPWSYATKQYGAIHIKEGKQCRHRMLPTGDSRANLTSCPRQEVWSRMAVSAVQLNY
jgi:hypothetical protein